MNISNKNYFDHDADIGIIGRGHSIEDAFIEAAEATFSIMTELQEVAAVTCIDIEFNETDNEFAFLTWLNLLIGEARAHNMIFCKFELKQKNGAWRGKACGNNWDDTLQRGVEVKGATLTMLSVKKINDSWDARCIVDV